MTMPGHTHTDDRLTIGCPACIARTQRDQDAAMRAEFSAKPWLAPLEWREAEAAEIVSEAREELRDAEMRMLSAEQNLELAEDSAAHAADPIRVPELAGQLTMMAR